MNDLFTRLWKQLSEAGAAARWAAGACALLVVAVSALFLWQARNPHFVVLAADLDTPSFNRAVKALAEAGIRYETSMGPEPFLIRVEEGRKYDALNAVHLAGDFGGGPRGIVSALQGSSSAFLGQSERHQRTQKRLWEEAEMQLERLDFVARAKVTVSGASSSPLVRPDKDRKSASVVLTLRGTSSPSRAETRALVGIVRGATGVPDERVTIVDQHSKILFDGSDEDGPDSLLALEERFARDRTDAVQSLLDKTFGPGLSIVGVSGEWREVREESVAETLDPSRKPSRQRTRTSEQPEWPRSIGGPAGVAANTREGAGPTIRTGTVEASLSKTSEEETTYSFGSRTTHTIAQPHQLARLSISLVVDSSISERLPDAEGLVMGLVGFDASRGDRIESTTTDLPGLERDADGAPIAAGPSEATEPIGDALWVALEYGLELIAGIAFLIVLVRSLRGSKRGRSAGHAGRGGRAPEGRPGSRPTHVEDGDAVQAIEEGVDLDALARAHIEDLLENEPEKVSALLSRWALAEDVYASPSAR
ncbi:MAG: flagellar M-ring protein FliF C-terminal domain-containing protein [Planctomycetota bacterium]